MIPLIRKFELYCQEALGIEALTTPWSQATKLPLFLREAYEFYEVNLMKKALLLAADKKREERPPATIQKQLAQVQQRWHHPVVYMRPKITSYNRHRLIKHQVPFVVPGNQLYLPMLCMDLRERFGQEREARPMMSPSTQALMLQVLYSGGTDPLSPGEMARRLHYTPMTMTRAFAELQQLRIGEHIAQRKNRQLLFTAHGRDLWKKVLPFMRTPVRRCVQVEGTGLGHEMIVAGLAALAQYSMIAEPAIPVYACDAETWKTVKKRLKLAPLLEPGVVQIEIWSYRPDLFAKKGIADRLSLYLSLRDEDDERIAAALETMMREMPW